MNTQIQKFVDATKIRNLLIGLFVFILLVLAIAIQMHTKHIENIDDLLADVAIMPPRAVGAIDLVDHQNNLITSDNLLNHWTFVFFGFTNCPDVCPSTLMQLASLNRLIAADEKFDIDKQFLFVSVDPERDTTKHLSDYVTYFDTSFVGATGSAQSIRQFETSLGAFHRIESKDSEDFYTVQHSADIFLVDPEAKLIARFRPPIDLENVVKQLKLFVQLHDKRVS